MPAARWVILLLLIGVALSFAVFALTGQPRFKRYGLEVLKWTVIAGLVFFAVLALERLA